MRSLLGWAGVLSWMLLSHAPTASASGFNGFNSQNGMTVTAPPCAFLSLRHILAYSAPGAGLLRCRYCTFDAPGCTLSCALCPAGPGSWAPSEAQLGACSAAPGAVGSLQGGGLTCATPSPAAAPSPSALPKNDEPRYVNGTVEVYLSHSCYNESCPPALSYALRLDEQQDGAAEGGGGSTRGTFSLGAAADDADIATGDKIALLVASRGAGGADGGRRRRRGLLSGSACPADAPLCFEPLDILRTRPGDGEKDIVINGRPINLTSIFMLASVCGAANPLSLQTLRAALFNASTTTSSLTMQNYFQTCSYNQLRFLPGNNLVVAVELPCSGFYQWAADGVTPLTYNSTAACGDAELDGWMRDATSQAIAKLGLTSTAAAGFKRRVLLLPNRRACSWPGLATVGCDSACSSWINQRDPWVDMQTLFQELGHNTGLHHANRWVNGQNAEYGDFTDPMGSGYPSYATDYYGNRTMYCMSAPESWKAGWSVPVANFSLQGGTLPPSAHVNVTLPSMHAGRANFLYINVSRLPDFVPSWPAGAAPLPRSNQIFVSYRVRQPGPGYDSAMETELNRRVWVHNFNASARSPPRPDPSAAPMKPSLLAVLARQSAVIRGGGMTVDTAWRQDWGNLSLPRDTGVNGLVVRPLVLNTTHAVVSVCYFRFARESDMEGGCDNGTDDDCDGVPDPLEPECGYVAPRPPSPAPPRPPPPGGAGRRLASASGEVPEGGRRAE